MNSQGFQSLIVGIDFSLFSKSVVKEAQLLGKKLNLPITYVHVLKDLRVYRDFLGMTRPGVEEEFTDKAMTFYRLSDSSDIRIEVGGAAEKILEVAEDSFRPLILVGGRGGHTVSKFFIGSTAETLAFTSKYPVWIHRGKSVKIPKKFLMPSDLSAESDRALQRIEPLRKDLKARLQLHHVYQEPAPLLGFPEWQSMNQQMRADDRVEFSDYAKKHAHLKMTRSTGYVPDEIQKKSKGFDLLALRPKRSGHRRMVFGGVMTKVMRSVENPILILP